MTYENRWKQTEAEINAAFPDKANKMKKHVEPVLMDAEFCNNLEEEFFDSSWSYFKILKGNLPINNLIKEKGLERCLKSKSTHLLVVGKKRNGNFITGEYKNYWLKVKSTTH